MKTLQNIKFEFKGNPVKDENQVQLDTLSLIKIVLENSNYENAGSLMQAIKVVDRLKEEEGNITLDEADYDFIKKYAEIYMPVLSKGLMFADFFKQLE